MRLFFEDHNRESLLHNLLDANLHERVERIHLLTDDTFLAKMLRYDVPCQSEKKQAKCAPAKKRLLMCIRPAFPYESYRSGVMSTFAGSSGSWDCSTARYETERVTHLLRNNPRKWGDNMSDISTVNQSIHRTHTRMNNKAKYLQLINQSSDRTNQERSTRRPDNQSINQPNQHDLNILTFGKHCFFIFLPAVTEPIFDSSKALFLQFDRDFLDKAVAHHDFSTDKNSVPEPTWWEFWFGLQIHQVLLRTKSIR